MEQLLTATVARNLYWLGRYLERVEETLKRITVAYDDIIDTNKQAGEELYENFSIPLTYENAKDFLKQAIFGQHSANLVALTSYSRENAIICRNHISAEAFGEIIALHDIFKNSSNEFSDVDYKLIDSANSLINEMWGELAKDEAKTISNHFLKLGKLVEKVDFNFRFEKDKAVVVRLVDRMNNILQDLEAESLLECKEGEDIDYEAVIDAMNATIESIIKE
jgi:uncharacterized alpha-E superfamily protein